MRLCVLCGLVIYKWQQTYATVEGNCHWVCPNAKREENDDT